MDILILIWGRHGLDTPSML